jgi:hypothetical protein
MGTLEISLPLSVTATLSFRIEPEQWNALSEDEKSKLVAHHISDMQSYIDDFSVVASDCTMYVDIGDRDQQVAVFDHDSNTETAEVIPF